MEILIDIRKIRNNISVIQDMCLGAGIQTVWVTKGCHSHSDIIRVLGEMNGEILGDVYPSNLKRIAGSFPGQTMMINFPAPYQANESVMYADIIMISSSEHAEMLSVAAGALNKKQRVLLMVDVGNLREGIMCRNVKKTVQKILSFPGINLVGLGTSVGCYGGYVAGAEDMLRLVKIARDVETEAGYKFQILSAGSGTILLDMVRAGTLPRDINQLRIGAAFLVGEKPPNKEPIFPLCQDSFVFRGTITELSQKPSLPAAQTGVDAFGKKVFFKDMGERTKALLNFGVIDVDPYDLTPTTPGINIIGATSNYTLCDVSHCNANLSVGTCLEFRMGYSAMARAMASRYVRKTVL